MENEEINIGDTVSHEQYGVGQVKFFDGTNIVDFNGRMQSVFDWELTKLYKPTD